MSVLPVLNRKIFCLLASVQYLPDSGLVVTDKIRNCQFSGNPRKWKEGDTGQEVELDLVPSHIEWGKTV